MDKLNGVDDWVAYIQTLHYRAIDMTLDRAGEVFNRLALDLSESVIITVGGTNGKGSCVAMLESICLAQGYSTCAFTSPHLISFNERIRINGQDVSDDQLLSAFEYVEKSRGDVSLTYFEFATLVAITVFSKIKATVILMETGMGGRLDCVNLLDPNCVLITHIAIDHTQWLGETKEKIGLEKAHLFRADKPAIYADKNPVSSVISYAKKINAKLQLINSEFSYVDNNDSWDFHVNTETTCQMNQLPHPSILGHGQLKNAAGVLMTLYSLQDKLLIDESSIKSGLKNVSLSGRLQSIQYNTKQIILDVAHNKDAIEILARYLSENKIVGKTIAVFAILADKDIINIVKLMSNIIQKWHVATLDEPRGENAEMIAKQLYSYNKFANVTCQQNPKVAFIDALKDVGADDRMVVFGSFHTVGEVLNYIKSNQVIS